MKPNILLIVLDCVKYDALVDSNLRIKYPHIRKLAEEGIIYHKAFSTSSWSPPPHASLFTGLYPPEHGVMSDSYLDQKNTTLASTLKNKGYFTFGLSDNVHICAKRGFNKGFDEFFENLNISFNLNNLKESIQKSINKNKPFFGFINLLKAHPPYNLPEKFRSQQLKDIQKNLSEDELNKITTLAHKGGYSYMSKTMSADLKDWSILRMMYDSTVLFNDSLLGKIISFLKTENVYDNSLIIITSDHGENFGDHNLAYHQFCLYNSLLHVPLIIKIPNLEPFKSLKGTSFYGLISLIDIPYSLTNLFNVDLSGDGLNILDKTIAEKGHDEIFATYVPSNTALNLIDKHGGDKSMFESKIRTIITKKWKFIEYSNKKNELFDIQEDFKETRNLISKYPDIALDLQKKLMKKFPSDIDNSSSKGYDDFEENVKKKLEELGYL